MIKPSRRYGLRTLAGTAIIAVASFAACGGGHHLSEYPFSSRTLAVIYIAPPAPELLTSYYDLRSSQNPIEAVVRAGADVAREREGRRANARLDSATARIDIPAVLAQRTLAGKPIPRTRPIQMITATISMKSAGESHQRQRRRGRVSLYVC